MIILVGCVKKDAIRNVTDEEVIRGRVQEYWSYNIKEEYDKSYDFEYPLYRKMVSRIDYIRGIKANVKWLKADLKKVDVDGDSAKVTVWLDTKIEGLSAPNKPQRLEMRSRENEMIEKWTKIDGIWYHVPKKL
ncbi:MAG: hypothetical protein C0402_06370 [Thermodesulfovibrio sp.]|nr:hypothetical protein [Thermodesulfovibrio sp.]